VKRKQRAIEQGEGDINVYIDHLPSPLRTSRSYRKVHASRENNLEREHEDRQKIKKTEEVRGACMRYAGQGKAACIRQKPHMQIQKQNKTKQDEPSSDLQLAHRLMNTRCCALDVILDTIE
jgi:hypothetical protein